MISAVEKNASFGRPGGDARLCTGKFGVASLTRSERSGILFDLGIMSVFFLCRSDKNGFAASAVLTYAL